MANVKKRNPARHFWWVLAMSAILLVLLPSLYRQQSQRLAGHYRNDLKTLPDEAVAGYVTRLESTDGLGLPILIGGLNSPRAPVRDACRQSLIERCVQGAAPATERFCLVTLAEQLAEGSAKFGQHGRQAAAEIAFELLSSPGVEATDRQRMLLACEQILQHANRTSKFTDADRPALAARPRATTAAEMPLPAQTVVMATAAGDRIPPVISARHATVDGLRSPPSSLPGAEVMPELRGGNQLEQEPLELDSRAQDVKSRSKTPGILPAEIIEAKPLPVAEASEADASAPRSVTNLPAAAAMTAEAVSELGTIELAQLLKRPDMAVAAEAELAQRGFTGMYLEVVQRLTDPDPAIRRRWTAALPGVSGLDARPWLLWLCRDDDADVRLTAITLLATTADPDVLREIKQLSQSDPDPRIQKLAQKLAAPAR